MTRSWYRSRWLSVFGVLLMGLGPGMFYRELRGTPVWRAPRSLPVWADNAFVPQSSVLLPPRNSLETLQTPVHWLPVHWFGDERFYVVDGKPQSIPHFKMGLREDGVVVWERKEEEQP